MAEKETMRAGLEVYTPIFAFHGTRMMYTTSAKRKVIWLGFVLARVPTLVPLALKTLVSAWGRF